MVLLTHFGMRIDEVVNYASYFRSILCHSINPSHVGFMSQYFWNLNSLQVIKEILNNVKKFPRLQPNWFAYLSNSNDFKMLNFSLTSQVDDRRRCGVRKSF